MDKNQNFAETWRAANHRRIADLHSYWPIAVLTLLGIGLLAGGLTMLWAPIVELAGQYP
jgi:hypothetical protein